MNRQMGIATIPLIFGLLLLVALPLTLNQVQQNQDIRNRATTDIVCLNIGQTNCLRTPCCLNLQCINNTCSVSHNNPPIQIPTSTPTLTQHKFPCSFFSSLIATYCSTRDCLKLNQFLSQICPS